MNFIWGATYGLASPLTLAVAAPLVIGSVVYAYLRRGNGKRHLVPTLYLLKALQGVPRSRQRFFPPLRFFFELVLLSLLILGASGLYQISKGEKIALVIDNSLSLAASSGDIIRNELLLDKSVSISREFINELPSNSEMEIFVTSPSLRSLTGELAMVGRAENLLKDIVPAYSTDKIPEVIQKLGNDSRYDKIVVVTDKSKSTTPQADSTAQDKISIRNVRARVANEFNNISINSISLSSDNFGNKGRTLSIAVDSFINSEMNVKVTVSGCVSSEGCRSFRVIDQRTIKLNPKSSQLIEFKNIPQKENVFQADLLPVEGANFDSILIDNRAYLALNSKQSRNAVISDLTIKELGLDLVEAVAFDRISPSAYESSLGLISSGEYSSLIFHRYNPRQLPASNAIFVMPSTDSPLFNLANEIRGAEITRWDASSPILSYINVPGLKFKLLRPIYKPDWANEIINTTHGAALIAGHSGGYRYAVFGFEIFPYEGKKTPITSILTLNSLKWIANFSSTVGYREVNSPINLDSDISTIKYLDGEELFERENYFGPVPDSVVAWKPGVLEIKKNDGSSAFEAFNFFSREESDTLNPGSVSTEFSDTLSDDISENKRSLISWLTRIIFVLLAIDLIFLLFISIANFIKNKRQAGYRYGN